MAASPSKAGRGAELARSLDISPQDLKQARRSLSQADSNVGAPKAQKAEFVARRLRLTPPEVKVVRAALCGQLDDATMARARLLVRHVLGLRSRGSSSSAHVPPATPTPVQGLRTHSRSALTIDAWTLETRVFITALGDAVHIFNNCHGMRGFRHPDEPDPIVHQVDLRHPACLGRKACRKCIGSSWSAPALDRLDLRIAALHGERDPARAVPLERLMQSVPSNIGPPTTRPRKRAMRCSDPDPTPASQLERLRDDATQRGISLQEAAGLGSIARPAMAAPARRSAAAGDQRSGGIDQSNSLAKEQRDRRAAEELGISVAALKERRRAESARDLALHEEASRLGITVKDLRRRLSA